MNAAIIQLVLFGFIFILLSVCLVVLGEAIPMASQDVCIRWFGRSLLRSPGEIFRFGIDVSILNLFAVGTSCWLSGRGRGRNGVKKNAVEHWFAKES